MHSVSNDISAEVNHKEEHNTLEPPGVINENSCSFYGIPTFDECSQGHCNGEDNEQDCHYSGREYDRRYFILHLGLL